MNFVKKIIKWSRERI